MTCVIFTDTFLSVRSQLTNQGWKQFFLFLTDRDIFYFIPSTWKILDSRIHMTNQKKTRGKILGLKIIFLGRNLPYDYTPSVPVKSLRFSVTIHYNVAGAGM